MVTDGGSAAARQGEKKKKASHPPRSLDDKWPSQNRPLESRRLALSVSTFCVPQWQPRVPRTTRTHTIRTSCLSLSSLIESSHRLVT